VTRGRGRLLGAVIAGGSSTRFGSPKALALVGGVRVVDRVVAALEGVVPRKGIVAIVNDTALAERIGLPHRADVIANAGALGGVHAALCWARDEGAAGILACGCDMPFIATALLRVLADDAAADVVVPESGGRRGIEPLCALYRTTCVPAIETAIAGGDARMVGFHDAVSVRRIPLDTVRALGDPRVLFMNINTEADREEAERLARMPS
jgi:molybdopterin-guanine dinucleotide biosynthesis protein A